MTAPQLKRVDTLPCKISFQKLRRGSTVTADQAYAY